METGDRVVQRELDAGRAVVARSVENIARNWLVLCILFFAAAFLPIIHVSAAALTQQQLVQKYCPADSGATQIGNADTPSGTEVACLDDSGNFISGNFDSATLAEISTDEGGSLAATTNASDLEAGVGQEIQTNAPILSDTGCPLPWGWDWNQCVWNPLLSGIGQLLVSIAGWILGVVGIIFDTFMTWTILNFKGTLDTLGITQSIDIVWALFRDVGNILIIGMFVFVAISTILGIESYGAKKWIAKILIVAVLINFSMFFTKFAIDVSNYVALEIYNGMSELSNQTVSGTGAGGETITSEVHIGIGQAFVKKIGTDSLFDSASAKTDPLSIITYSLGATIFMLFVALVLLYGCFLLASRAVLLLFLLLTSSLAFASILLPGGLAKRGWGAWKESLIKTTIFAPLLMLFFYLTLTVLGAGSAPGGSLGQFITDPSNSSSGAVTIVILFVFASGLLFISMKLANSFAAGIAGFDYAAALPVLGGAAAATATSFGLRNSVGRGATRLSEMQATRAKELTAEGKHVRAGFANVLSGMGGNIGKQDFNALNTRTGRNITGLAGGEKGPVGGILKKASTVGKGGFPEQEKRAVKKQQEYAEKLAPTPDQQKKVREEALANATPAQKQALQLGQQKELAAQAQKEALAKEHEQAAAALKQNVQKEAANANANPNDPVAQQRLANAVASHTQMKEQQQVTMNQVETRIAQAKKETDAALQGIVPKEALQSKGENMADIAHRRATNIPWRMAGQTTEKDKIAQKVRGAVKKKEDTDKEKARLQMLVGDAASTLTPPPGAGTP